MNKIRFIFFLLFFISIATLDLFATHNRAGEITYEWIGRPNQSDLRYKITITTFTKTSSIQADRPTLDSVYWGDGSPAAVFVRVSKTDLPNNISKNIYINYHTYAGTGKYIIHFTDPNRNENVVNIPRSVSVPFYLESTLVINSFLGNDDSPILNKEPIDQGCENRIFKHNPAAFDPDGDSLSYELIECGGDNGQSIPGYTFPAASHSFTLNPVTGDLIWDSPMHHVPAPSEYNVAFNIIEWRNGFQIGSVRRDMQIVINVCDDHPPVIEPLNDTCVLAGDSLKFLVTANDEDGDNIILTGYGGPFDSLADPDHAQLHSISSNSNPAISQFVWATKCHHVRPQPYFVLFDASSGSSPTLVDLKGVFIKIIAPPPPSLTATPNGSAINLNWTPPLCTDLIHYNIYRRNGQFPGTIDCPCDNGVPAITGYSLIGTSNGTDTTFVDSNNGQGLTIGIEYCYLVTALYANGSESCASPQTCASLKKDAPVITNADVLTTDIATGSVYIGWSKPTELDTIAFPKPYQYRVYRSPGFFGAAFGSTEIALLNDLNDTSFIDTGIDTKTQPWSYKIALYYDSLGTPAYKGQTAVASTIFLSIAPTDNKLILTWEEHVPWNNSVYRIFKQNASLGFDSIDSVMIHTYIDTGLVNGNQYCYYIKSVGSYAFSGFIDPILNKSQIDCEIPVDNVHPCSPALIVNSYCDDSQNELIWTNPNNYCADDVLKYYIYFSSNSTNGFELIDSTLSPTDTTYMHTHLSRLSGCYKVTAIDSVGNETLDPQVVCVDTCRQYVLPSVFTPDGDGKNDLYHPCDASLSSTLGS